MSFTLLLIQDNHLEHLGKIYALCGYKEPYDDRLVENINALYRYELDYSLPIYYACVVNGWAVIEPISGAISLSEDKCQKLSRQFDTHIFTCILVDDCASYRFAWYDKAKLRELAVVEGMVEKNTGVPLSIEEGIDYTKIIPDDVFLMLNRLGVDRESLNNAPGIASFYLMKRGTQRNRGGNTGDCKRL